MKGTSFWSCLTILSTLGDVSSENVPGMGKLMDCQQRSTSGRDYGGKANTTVDGIPCQRWSDKEPHDHRQVHPFRRSQFLPESYWSWPIPNLVLHHWPRCSISKLLGSVLPPFEGSRLLIGQWLENRRGQQLLIRLSWDEQPAFLVHNLHCLYGGSLDLVCGRNALCFAPWQRRGLALG